MASYSKEELKKFTVLNDKLSPYFAKIVRNTSIFNKYKHEVARIMDKNSGNGRANDPSNVLQSSIVGRQLLINKEDIKKLKEALGYPESDLLDAYSSSPYFQQFEDLARKEPLLYTIPLLIYSAELYKAGKKSESKFVYFSAFLREYASRVYRGWPHGVNEGRMYYTIEYSLNDRYDIKKLGTAYAVLLKMAEASHAHYIDIMCKNLTDSLLYDITNSGISTRIVSFLQSISKEYQKNEGKYLNFEHNSAISKDEETEGTSYNLEIKSNAAVKKNAVNKALIKISTASVNDAYIRIAVKRIFKPESINSSYNDMLRVNVKEILDQCKKEMPEFLDAIVSYFLYSINPITGQRNMESDMKTIKFILSVERLYKSSNTKDPNIIKVKNFLEDFLKRCSYEYNSYKSSQQKNQLEKAVLMYFAILLQQSA